MAYLSSQELDKKGDRYGLVKRNKIPHGCDLLAYLWMDQYRRYFIASGSSIDSGDNMEMILSLQIEDVSKNAYPVDVTLTIQQPKVPDIYYGACYKIDRHNR